MRTTVITRKFLSAWGALVRYISTPTKAIVLDMFTFISITVQTQVIIIVLYSA